MVKKQTSLTNWSLSFDVFAKPVNLTFQGQDKFKTHIGATLTLICGLLVLCYSVFRFIPILGDTNTTITKNTILING